jgi:glycosyltransferase involved in cell wall biosynthesis
MKVALLGNMNNNLFALMRYLLDAGIETKLYTYPDDPSHFSPESDTFEISNYKNNIEEIDFSNPFKFWKLNKDKLRKELLPYDIILVSGYGPFLMNYCKIKNYVFIPYGSDLYEYPFTSLSKRSKGLRNFILYIFDYLFVSSKQRKGIKNANAVINIDIIQSYSFALNKLNKIPVRINVPMVYDYSSSYVLNNDNGYNQTVNKYLSKITPFTFVVISQSRQYWTKSIDGAYGLDMKGNDILIRGFNNFKLNSPNSKLILFEYGPDVNASKELINHLDLTDSVIWIPKIPRKYILRIIKEFANLGADQFTSGYFGGTGYEIMSQGVPLLTNINLTPEKYIELIGAPLPPITNVCNFIEVSEALTFYYNNPAALKLKSVEVKKYFDEELGMGLAKKHINLYSQIIKNKSLNVN